jgi:hypothetical protein
MGLNAMSTSTESYFIRSGRLKRMVSTAGQLKSHANATKDGDLLSVASMVQSLISESDYLVGIPDESYPTKFSGKELNLDSMDDGVTIRAEMKAGELGRVLAAVTQTAKRLRDVGDKMAETADLLVTILTVMKEEEYRGKTHQVASFDPLGERLGFLP